MKRYMIVFVICITSAFSFNSSLLNFDPKEVIQADSILFPEIKHREQTKLINQLLTRYHYKKISFDDSLSVKILKNYIKSLDPNREYFYDADIKYFDQYKYEIDNYIKNGYLEPIYEIFTVYNERVRDRIDYVFDLLSKEPDFTFDEEFFYNRKDREWFSTEVELNDHWRKKIKYSILNMKILGKSWKDNQETLDKRYKRFQKTISQFNNEDVFEIFINSYTELYDPHTNYFSPA